MDTATSATPSAGSPPSESPYTVLHWPAQVAMVSLLGLAAALLAVHGYRGLRWGSQTTEVLEPIDLNRAGQTELLQVPGLGASLAQRIETYRLEHGGFQSFNDLQHVRGIGPTILERLRPWFCVRSAGAETAAAASNKERGSRKSATKKKAPLVEPVNINQATAVDLQRLPGIGPKRAQLILEERRKGPFRRVEELRRVSGIGPKTLEKLRPHIIVESDPVRMAAAGGP